MSVCVSYFLPCFTPWTHLTCNTPVTVHITFDRVLIRRRYTNCLWTWTADDIRFLLCWSTKQHTCYTRKNVTWNQWLARKRAKGKRLMPHSFHLQFQCWRTCNSRARHSAETDAHLQLDPFVLNICSLTFTSPDNPIQQFPNRRRAEALTESTGQQRCLKRKKKTLCKWHKNWLDLVVSVVSLEKPLSTALA